MQMYAQKNDKGGWDIFQIKAAEHFVTVASEADANKIVRTFRGVGPNTLKETPAKGSGKAKGKGTGGKPGRPKGYSPKAARAAQAQAGEGEEMTAAAVSQGDETNTPQQPTETTQQFANIKEAANEAEPQPQAAAAEPAPASAPVHRSSGTALNIDENEIEALTAGT